MRQWSELPVNLLEELENHLILYVDKVRMRAVCVSWNSHLPNLPNQKERQFPWLLQELDNSEEATHALFNPIEKKFYHLYLPEAQGKLFKGSSHGWVATVEDKHSTSPTDIYLINPLTRARIKLPPRSKFPDVRTYRANKHDQEYALFKQYRFYSSEYMNISFTDKFVLSFTPSSNDCVVVAIYNQGRLAYCKCNDKKWRPLDLNGAREVSFVDVIIHKGKLHALNSSGELLLFESIGIGTTKSKVRIIASEFAIYPAIYPVVPCLKYLVESSDGGLVMVARGFNFLDNEDKYIPPIPCTACFKIFKLDSNNSTWVEVKNIGNDIFFVGLNSSFSVPSNHFPQYKGNHIYFTDSINSYFGMKNKQEDADIGVFNVEDGTLQSLQGLKCHPKFFWPPPVWVNV